MRMTFTKFLATAALSAAAAMLALSHVGCSKLGMFAPKQVCACESIWNDPTCPQGELGVDTAVFLVPCPDGLSPRGDAGISLIKSKDVDFDEMASATINQVIAWTGMNLTKVTGSTNGQWRGEVASNGRSQFAQVLGCAVIKLDEGQKPESVKGWWKSGNTGSKLRSPPIDPSSPTPPSPPGPPDLCDTPVVDEISSTVTFPAGCGPVADIASPGNVASCNPPSCPADASDSTCVACAKANCCADVAACQADGACTSVATCLLTSGGLASCTSVGLNSTIYYLGLCLTTNCSSCAQPVNPGCGHNGDACGGAYPVCCSNMGLACYANAGGTGTCM